MSPSTGGYQILDWIGDWNGDPGSGWDVAGVNAATKDHTLIRKCDLLQGDTSWINATGTNPVNSQWIVLANDDWSDIGQHIILPCNLVYGCMDFLACNYDSNVVIDDASCIYPGQPFQYNISICNGESIEIAGNIYDTTGLYIDSLISSLGCDSLVFTNLIVNPNIAFTNNQTICIGETYTINGNVYDSTGSYIDSLQTIEGCDSIVTLNLTVNNLVSSIDNVGSHCDSYTWIDGNTYYSSNNSASVTYVNATGCDSIVTLNLTINDNPVVSISYVNNDLSAVVTGGVSPYSYQWTGPVNANNQTVTPLVSGNYCVQVADINGCNSGQICENLTISGVIDISINNDLTLYPNPTNEQLTIDFTTNATSIKVYNMLGELIIEQKITDDQSAVQLSVCNYKVGTYNVQLHKQDGSVIQKTFNVVK
tara:strand:- start:145 stop:1413 length:1269 start_codon:yes stop_codon:yes gene_type:complete